MTEDHAGRFVALFCAGAGLLLVGGVNLLLARAGRRLRVAATFVACGVALAAATALRADGSAVGPSAGLLAGAILPCLVLGVGRVRRAVAAVGRATARPPVRWGGLAAVGVAALIGSVARYEAADDAAQEQALAELDMLTARPSTDAGPPGVTTDRGTPIEVRAATSPRGPSELAEVEAKFVRHTPLGRELIRRQPGSDHANCHGWVFTGGRYWVACETVPLILEENGYAAVADPRPGDLAVYGDSGPTQHTAVVRYVAAGAPPVVEGKWGPGPVYMHTADVPCYGGVTAYYRSPRRGHVLRGIHDR